MLVAKAQKLPGRLSMELMQRLADQVGQDGIQDFWSRWEIADCVQVYFNRVMASEEAGGHPCPSEKGSARGGNAMCHVRLDGKCGGDGWMP